MGQVSKKSYHTSNTSRVLTSAAQLFVLNLVSKPGIYLREIQKECLMVEVSVSAICKCLHKNGFIHQILPLPLLSCYEFSPNALAKAAAAPLIAVENEGEEGRGLRGVDTNAGIVGGVSKSSRRLLATICAHKCSLGVSYLVPCFSFSSWKTEPTSSFFCHLDDPVEDSSLLHLQGSSSEQPLHHRVICPDGFFRYMVSKSASEQSHILECCSPSK